MIYKWTLLTVVALALFYVWAHAAVINPNYMELAGFALTATLLLGFRATYLAINGLIDRFNKRRPQGSTPNVINHIDWRRQARPK